MARLNAKLFESALADTIAWCRTKLGTVDVATEQVRCRQESYYLAEQQWKEAIDTEIGLVFEVLLL